MRFAIPRAGRPKGESVVPMINVVFLLLIFFLMSAAVAPPEPVEVSLPGGDGPEAAGEERALYVSADGEVAFGQARGDAAILAAAGAGPLDIRADAALPAAELARVLGRLAATGLDQVRLVMVRE